MTAIVVVAVLTLLTSFLCSTLEAALYAVTPPQLEVLQKNRVFGARRFSRLRERIEEPIAAILTVNTISHTVGASVAGALVGEHFGSLFIGWFAAIFTLCILFFSEIVPKSIGVRFAPQLVSYLIWPLQILIWLSYPVARPCYLMMRRLTGVPKHDVPTEEEIIAMSRIAARRGSLTELEMSWIENALLLDQVSARDLMTPRTVVHSVPAERTVRDALASPGELRHSRFPVYEGGDPDRLAGVVHRRDMYDALAGDRGGQSLRELVRPLEYVPEGMKGPQLLEKFIRGKRHMVAVIDEYGGFEGIVTLEDVLECLIGVEIVDEHDEHVDMQELARRLRNRRPEPLAPSSDGES